MDAMKEDMEEDLTWKEDLYPPLSFDDFFPETEAFDEAEGLEEEEDFACGLGGGVLVGLEEVVVDFLYSIESLAEAICG